LIKKVIKIRKLNNTDHAVAGVIVAILMIGLMISAIAFVQLVYVPDWMEKREAAHMDEVGRQFSQIKFAIDTLSISEKQRSITSPVTLGSSEMPFFATSRSYGSIDILSNDFRIIFEFYKDTELREIEYSVGALKYTSRNNYFIDQSYVFENGAVILSQSAGDTFYCQPNIFCEGTAITINLVKLLSLDGESSSISGFGTYPVQTRFIKTESKELQRTRSITIYNTHLDSWEDFFDNLLKDNTQFVYDILPTADGEGIQIIFEDPAGSANPYDKVYPYCFINEDSFEVKISPGIVK